MELRALRSANDYAECVSLQHQIWGADTGDTVPPAVLKISQEVGGIAAGAFEDQRMIGCVFGISGVRAGCIVHWSHMLAVRDGLRNRGIGRMLKLYQRDRLIDLGINTAFWSYDPLVARNAHFNLVRLGAVVEEYVDDMYDLGSVTKTNTVIGSDRLVVRWELSSRWERREETNAHPSNAPFVTIAPDPALEGRVQGDFAEEPTVLLEIPPDIQSLKLNTPDIAVAWRSTTRRAFHDYFARGYRVTTFVVTQNRAYYVLTRLGTTSVEKD